MPVWKLGSIVHIGYGPAPCPPGAYIEKALAARHLKNGAFALYDLSYSYLEGRCCPPAAREYSRDGKKGSLQLNWGLLCSAEGHPVAIRLHPGHAVDPDTVPAVVETLKEHFGIDRFVLVGDRAMITETHADGPERLGAGFVSALKSTQICRLLRSGPSSALPA